MKTIPIKFNNAKGKKKYWKWKSTTIDFAKLSNEKVRGQNYTKLDYIFHYLPVPDNKYNKRINGYDEDALKYAEELGLIEWVDEEEDER